MQTASHYHSWWEWSQVHSCILKCYAIWQQCVQALKLRRRLCYSTSSKVWLQKGHEDGMGQQRVPWAGCLCFLLKVSDVGWKQPKASWRNAQLSSPFQWRPSDKVISTANALLYTITSLYNEWTQTQRLQGNSQSRNYLNITPVCHSPLLHITTEMKEYNPKNIIRQPGHLALWWCYLQVN